MKKGIVRALFAALAAFPVLAFAAADDLPYGYHSVGIDTYGDQKTQVIDGECYALVWMADGQTFSGFTCDGKLIDAENNDVVYVRSLAIGGRCPPVNFVVTGEYQAAHPGGGYRVVVLDTRVSDDELAGLNDDGTLRRVNGWGWAKGEIALLDLYNVYIAGIPEVAGAPIGTAARVPANCRRPRITKFELKADGTADLEFTGSENYLSYQWARGETPAEGGAAAGGSPRPGVGDDDTPVRFVLPKSALGSENGFFSVKVKEDWTGGADK